MAFHADLPAGQVFRLYGAALGRKPDPIGFGEVGAGDGGRRRRLKAIAAGFVGSAEFAARFGAPDNAGFVTLLYGNVLGRAPDAAGLNHWLNAMAHRHAAAPTRCSASPSRPSTSSARPPTTTQASGFRTRRRWMCCGATWACWTACRTRGASRPGRRRARPGSGNSSLIEGFVGSPEFQTRFGGLSNRDFVEQLYRTALDRDADPDGRGAWTRALDSGIDGRAGRGAGLRRQRRDDGQAHAPGRGRDPLGLSTGPHAVVAIGSPQCKNDFVKRVELIASRRLGELAMPVRPRPRDTGRGGRLEPQLLRPRPAEDSGAARQHRDHGSGRDGLDGAEVLHPAARGRLERPPGRHPGRGALHLRHPRHVQLRGRS